MAWSLNGSVVLLEGSVEDAMKEVFSTPATAEGGVTLENPTVDMIRVVVQNLGGQIAYAEKPPAGSVYGDTNPDPSTATHEYVRSGASALTNLPQLTLSELKNRVQELLIHMRVFYTHHERSAYIPTLAAIEGEEHASRYFGRPWLPNDFVWPVRGEANEPMKFVAQFNIASLPSEVAAICGGEGLLVFFHDDGGDYPEGPGIIDNRSLSHVRVVHTNVAGGIRHEGHNEPGQTYTITGWQAVKDHPHSESRRALEGYDDTTDYVQVETLVEFLEGGKNFNKIEEAQLRDDQEHTMASFHCFSCDKVGGWPAWEQGDETPVDSTGKPMTYVMQIGYEGLLLPPTDLSDVSWPTWGRGHIFYSAHDQEFIYLWSSS